MPGDLLRIRVAGDDDLLVRLDQRVEEVEELLLRAALAAEELDVVDQQQVERAVVALEIVERLVLVGAHDVGHVGLGVDVADLAPPGCAAGCRCRSPASGASCRGRRRRRRRAGCRRSGARRPACPAARASWFALPATNEANVKPGLRLVCSCRRGSAGGVAADAGGRRSPRDGRRRSRAARPGRPAPSRASVGMSRDGERIGTGAPFGWRRARAIRSGKRSLTHCSTKRFGASSR